MYELLDVYRFGFLMWGGKTMKQLKWILSVCACLLMLSGSLAYAYDYPFADPYVATVLGTPAEFAYELPKEVPLKFDQFEFSQIDLFSCLFFKSVVIGRLCQCVRYFCRASSTSGNLYRGLLMTIHAFSPKTPAKQ